MLQDILYNDILYFKDEFVFNQELRISFMFFGNANCKI